MTFKGGARKQSALFFMEIAGMMKILDHLEEWFISFLMAGAVLLIFVAVVHRYLAGYPIPVVQDWLLDINLGWAQELCIIMFIWMAKFGAAYGVRTGIHVGVDVLVNRLGKKSRGFFVIISLLAGATFTGIVTSFGTHFVWENGMHYALFNLLGQATPEMFAGPTTPDLEWPTWAVYSAVPAGSALMCFRFLQVLVGFLRTGDLPHHDHGHVDGVVTEEMPADAHPSAEKGRFPYDLGSDDEEKTTKEVGR
jgi:C4-dicarboxylate transporter DctQ subunit